MKSDECKCGIHRQSCEYHKDQHCPDCSWDQDPHIRECLIYVLCEKHQQEEDEMRYGYY